MSSEKVRALLLILNATLVAVRSPPSATLNAAPGVLRLRSADGKSSAMILSHAVQASAGPTHGKLVFNKYGDEYFLFQVWPSGTGIGHELLKSRREAELAAARRETIRASK